MKKITASILLYCAVLQSCDYFVTAEFLYWYAQESDLSYALKVQGVNQISNVGISPVMLAPKNVKEVDSAWGPGARLGIGLKSERCWDLYADWTYFHSQKKNRASVGAFGTPALELFPAVGQYALVDPWTNVGNFTSVFDAPFLFDSVTAKWNLTLNIIDLELGYALAFDCFTLRPYAGLRGALLNIKFDNSASLSPSPSESILFKDRFTNQFWGVGLLAGLQPAWHFSSRWTLFSNINAALLWGRTHEQKKENYLGTEAFGALLLIDYKNKMRHERAQMQAILDLAIGLRFEESWRCGRYRTAIDLGWEQHFWFDAARRTKLNTAFLNDLGGGSLQFGFQGYEEESNNLVFGGPLLRARFEF